MTNLILIGFHEFCQFGSSWIIKRIVFHLPLESVYTFPPLCREVFLWNQLLEFARNLRRVNPFQRFAKPLPMLIRQFHIKAIFPINEGVKDHFVVAEVCPSSA